ncbi:MAG: hypothetical protein LBK58_06860 [Prevotellaceae bacterium]|jgi:hypothetical protein|nr:hypothetical protein [Prevotellaceae bacterium]
MDTRSLFFGVIFVIIILVFVYHYYKYKQKNTFWINVVGGIITISGIFVALFLLEKPTIPGINGMPENICAESLLKLYLNGTVSGAFVEDEGWQIERTANNKDYEELTFPYRVRHEDNGKRIRYFAKNFHGTSELFTPQIIVHDKPKIPLIIGIPDKIVAGNTLTPSLSDIINNNGSDIINEGWQIEKTANSKDYINVTFPYKVTYEDNGKHIRYFAINGCGTSEQIVKIAVYDKPKVPSIMGVPDKIFEGNTLTLSLSDTVNSNGSDIINKGWQIERTIGSNNYINMSLPYKVTYKDNGKHIRYFATNICGTSEQVVKITVHKSEKGILEKAKIIINKEIDRR